MQNQPSIPSAPWWRHGHVWLVISGPAAVLVACIVTTWIAVRSPDPVITEGRTQKAMVPALQGRNHAATPAPGAAR